jgi:regulatory protein
VPATPEPPDGPARRDRPRPRTFAERRERKAAVDDPAVVLEAAARFLESRSRSVAELRRRLSGAGYRPDLVEAAIARLTELGILDDAAFARSWIESRDRAHPRGERALRQELRLKGIDRALIDEVLDERGQAREADADVEAAARLLARHAHSLGRVADPRARRQRAYALLARNGFEPDVCVRAATAFVRDASDPEDGPTEEGPPGNR